MIQSVEVTPDIHVHDPSYLIIHALFPEVFEAIVRRASRSESERELLEFLFVDRFQKHRYRPLEHFVFRCRDADRPSFIAVPFRYRHPSYWRCMVAARLGSSNQIPQIALQFFPVLLH